MTDLTLPERFALRIAPSLVKPPPATAKPSSAALRRAVSTTGRVVGAGASPSWGWAVQAPPTPEEDWRTDLLDSETLARINAKELASYLVNLSPEASAALWNFLRLMNPGYTLRVLNRRGGRAYAKGQNALDDFLTKLELQHGSLDVMINGLMLMAWMRGAFLAELILDRDGRTPIDIATPDPWSVRFAKKEDPLRGEVYQLGQYQKGVWVPLDMATIRYTPIDPLPGAPYGRALVTPAIFPCLFLLNMLHDLRRVVSQQGYPRLDVVIELEKLLTAMPANEQDDPEKVQAWIDEAITQVSAAYAALEPDDVFIHPDTVTVNRPVGAIGSDSLGAVDGLIRAIERMAIRALKMMPVFMGSNEAVSETHARWQWEIQSAGIQALQHLAENLLGYLFGLALRAQGIDAVVELRFAQLNEMLRREKAETVRIEIENAARERDEGWISQDEASLRITGHAAFIPQEVPAK